MSVDRAAPTNEKQPERKYSMELQLLNFSSTYQGARARAQHMLKELIRQDPEEVVKLLAYMGVERFNEFLHFVLIVAVRCPDLLEPHIDEWMKANPKFPTGENQASKWRSFLDGSHGIPELNHPVWCKWIKSMSAEKLGMYGLATERTIMSLAIMGNSVEMMAHLASNMTEEALLRRSIYGSSALFYVVMRTRSDDTPGVRLMMVNAIVPHMADAHFLQRNNDNLNPVQEAFRSVLWWMQEVKPSIATKFPKVHERAVVALRMLHATVDCMVKQADEDLKATVSFMSACRSFWFAYKATRDDVNMGTNSCVLSSIPGEIMLRITRFVLAPTNRMATLLEPIQIIHPDTTTSVATYIANTCDEIKTFVDAITNKRTKQSYLPIRNALCEAGEVAKSVQEARLAWIETGSIMYKANAICMKGRLVQAYKRHLFGLRFV